MINASINFNQFDTRTLGDINDDGLVNVLDVVMMVNVAITQGYNEAADMNSDGVVNVLDVVILINIILDG